MGLKNVSLEGGCTEFLEFFLNKEEEPEQPKI